MHSGRACSHEKEWNAITCKNVSRWSWDNCKYWFLFSLLLTNIWQEATKQRKDLFQLAVWGNSLPWQWWCCNRSMTLCFYILTNQETESWDTIIVWISPFPFLMWCCHSHSRHLFPASILSPWKCPHGHSQMCASLMPWGFFNPFELTMKTHQHITLSETARCRKTSIMWPHSTTEYKKWRAHKNRVTGGNPKMGRGWSYRLIRISSFRTWQGDCGKWQYTVYFKKPVEKILNVFTQKKNDEYLRR